jgi:phosphonate transport system substrate-binding protein
MTTAIRQTIHFANFLSPLLEETYDYIANYASIRLGTPTTLHIGQTLEEFAAGQVDIGFVCGLLYTHMTKWPDCPVELLAAPVLMGSRYKRKPIYYSDVVVRRDSRYTSFNDLAGTVWAYNEAASHSGCNLVCDTLLQRKKTPAYFGRLAKSGSHLNSLQMVLDGHADATALDSHLLDVLLQRDPQLASRIRWVDMMGPSSIPPVVVAKRVDNDVKQQLRTALLTMHQHPFASEILHAAHIERFVSVRDEQYDDIRAIYARVQASGFAKEFL